MSDLVGKVISDRFHFSEHIGRGGMAEVYKVWDSQRVIYLAAKVLHKDMALDKIFLRRFKRESDTLTKLQHPHIVRSYGLKRDGRLAFLLMDYVDGESLKERIFDTEKPLPVTRVRDILRPVAGALHYAHNMGFVHCDIKPANIMMDKYGEVRLADFGIARMSDAATATMVGAGTPAYMAPEQIRGKDPVPQTDIYALGIVLFEMLTGGERPFIGEYAKITGSTSEKVRWEQIHRQPPSMKKWNPNISAELDAIVQKCLEKDRKNRYQNPLDLLNDFEKAITETGKVPIIQGVLAQESLSHSTVKSPTSSHPVHQPAKTQNPATRKKTRRTPQKRMPAKSKKTPVWAFILGGITLFSLIALIGVFLGSILGIAEASQEHPIRPSLTKTVLETYTPNPKDLIAQQNIFTATVYATSTIFFTPTKEVSTPTKPFDTATPPPTATESVLELEDCNSPPQKICFNSFGYSGSGLIITIKSPSMPAYDIYLMVDNDLFECNEIEGFPDRFFCEGPKQKVNIKTLVQVFRLNDKQLLSEGYFSFYELAPPDPPPSKKDDDDGSSYP